MRVAVHLLLGTVGAEAALFFDEHSKAISKNPQAALPLLVDGLFEELYKLGKALVVVAGLLGHS